jgi:phage gpG-like protein
MPIKAIRIKMPSALAEALKNPQSLIFKRLQAGIEDAAIAIQGATKANVIPGWNIGHQTLPKPHFTGRLNRSITYQMGRLKAIVGAHTPYAAIQEFGGTGGKKTGTRSGGIKPKRYFERGIEEAEGLIMKILNEAASEITGDAGFK